MTAGNQPSSSDTDGLRQELIAKAQYFVDCKYVARSDERQKAMGLAYVGAERADLAREIASFTMSVLAARSGGAAQGAPDQRCLEDMTLAHNARKTAIEECARACEARVKDDDSHNAPYNAEDMACAAAIRALSAITPSPGARERADRLEDERNRLQNSYGSGPFADGLITRRIAAIDKELSSVPSTQERTP